MKVSELIAKLKKCDGCRDVVVEPMYGRYVYAVKELKDTKQFVILKIEL